MEESTISKMKIEALKAEGTGDKVNLVKNDIFDGTNTFEVQYNPDNINVGFGQKIKSKNEVNSKEKSQELTGKDDDMLTFNLLFDTSMTKSANGDNVSVKTVYINKLNKLIKLKDSADAVICRVTWGSIISFVGVLQNMKVNYTMFSSNGLPLRAKVELSFIQKNMDTSSQLETVKSATINKKRVEIKAEEYLGLWAALEYGNVNKWKSIASANNIDNPRLMNPGDIITIP